MSERKLTDNETAIEHMSAIVEWCERAESPTFFRFDGFVLTVEDLRRAVRALEDLPAVGPPPAEDVAWLAAEFPRGVGSVLEHARWYVEQARSGWELVRALSIALRQAQSLVPRVRADLDENRRAREMKARARELKNRWYADPDQTIVKVCDYIVFGDPDRDEA
jgi:hypothetical protein